MDPEEKKEPESITLEVQDGIIGQNSIIIEKEEVKENGKVQ